MIKAIENIIPKLVELAVSIDFNTREKFYEDRINDAITILKNSIDEHHTSWISFKDNGIHTVTNNLIKDYQEFIKSIAKDNKVIIMSGTLTTQKNGKKELSNYWGLDINKFDYQKYPNTFDNINQTYLYVPKSTNPKKEIHLINTKRQTRILMNTLDNRQGMLVLCTSHDYVKNIGKYLTDHNKKRKILVQHEGAPTQKIGEIFQKNKPSILVGSDSFATGFSVPGESLQAVLITKLPYPVPTDPLLQLRIKSSKLSENKIQEMIMLKRLEQGMGRLIRDSKDYGIIEITDSRIYEKSKIIRWLQDKGYNIHESLGSYQEFKNNFINNSPDEIRYSRKKLIS